MPAPQTLIIGAGLSGMTCARRLAHAGHRVTVIDKGRRPSGRLATRTSRSGPVFDHGAQFFTVKTDAFRNQVSAWLDDHTVAEWNGRFMDLRDGHAAPTKRLATRYVGTPSMDAIVAALCAAHPNIDGPHFNHEAAAVVPHVDSGWLAIDAQGAPLRGRTFDRAVVAAPGAQASRLIAQAHSAFAQQLAATETAACWAAMLSFSKPLDLPFDGAFVEGDGPISWIARNTAKPGRPGAASDAGECWVAHASAPWSQQHVELTPQQALPRLIDAFGASTGTAPPPPTYAAAHRWRFAHVTTPLSRPYLHDAAQGIGVCGDVFCTGPRPNIEQAWRSGHDLAAALLAQP